jgi:hypothetical protein
VDKRSGKEVYLDGSWAEMFQQIILGWQLNAPTEEEVEDTLERYFGLAQNPVLVHWRPGPAASARARPVQQPVQGLDQQQHGHQAADLEGRDHRHAQLQHLGRDRHLGMPPGEVPSTRVARAGRWPASSQAKPAHKSIMASVPSATDTSQRGAVCRNPA